ncbi:MAG: sigma factor-like helix-turn-helix DNA-binding protein [Planctomycetota bacterium]
MLSQIVSDGTGPFGVVERADLLDLAQQALSELEPEERDLILLRDSGGAPWEELADHFGLSGIHVARDRHARASAKLAAAIAGIRHRSVLNFLRIPSDGVGTESLHSVETCRR